MGKNFKTLIGLLMIVLLASFCSSKKSSNAGLAIALLALNNDSSSSSSAKTATVDLSKAFDGLQDVMAVKSTSAVSSNLVSPALETNKWTRLGDAGAVKLTSGQKLSFAIVPKTGDIKDDELIEIGTYTGTGKTDTIGFGEEGKGGIVPAKDGSKDFTPDGITAVALVVQKNPATGGATFAEIKTASKKIAVAATAKAAEDAVAADTKLKTIPAIVNAVKEKAIKAAKEKAAAKEGTEDPTDGKKVNPVLNTSPIVFNNGSATISLTAGKFGTFSATNATITAAFLVTQTDLKGGVAKSVTLKDNKGLGGAGGADITGFTHGNPSVTVALKKINDTNAHLYLLGTNASISVTGNISFTVTFQKDAFADYKTDFSAVTVANITTSADTMKKGAGDYQKGALVNKDGIGNTGAVVQNQFNLTSTVTGSKAVGRK